MPAIKHTTILEPNRFTTSIRQTSEFLRALPNKEGFSELAPKTRHARIQDAIAKGAIERANQLEQDHGEYNLDANLYRLIGSLDSFYRDSQTLDQLRQQYGTSRYMPPKEKQEFYDSKDSVTDFNHIIREVINAGASKFDFDSLLMFMTRMQVASGNRENLDEFRTQTRQAVIGMRNEVSFEQVLIANGIEYTLGTREQDAEGGDIIMEEVPLDLKASRIAAEQAQEKARRAGRNPNRIIWSHISFKDYRGELILPYELNSKVFAEVKPDLDKALHS